MVNNTNNIKKTMYLRLASTWSNNYISPQLEAGTTYLSVAPAFNPGFYCSSCCQIVQFCWNITL